MLDVSYSDNVGGMDEMCRGFRVMTNGIMSGVRMRCKKGGIMNMRKRAGRSGSSDRQGGNSGVEVGPREHGGM